MQARSQTEYVRTSMYVRTYVGLNFFKFYADCIVRIFTEFNKGTVLCVIIVLLSLMHFSQVFR